MNSANMTKLLTQAFWNDPMFASLFSGTKKEQHMNALFGFLIKRNILIGGELLTDGETYAALLDKRARVPFSNKLSLFFEMVKLSFQLPLKSLRQLTVYQDIALANAPKGDHYYLTILGVAPSAQGKGVGGKVLGAIHEKLPKGMSIALDTENEKNVAYYERFGYTLNHVGRAGDLQIYCMSR